MTQIPKNIRQIGGREDRLKIYMEDYVNTYLRRVQEQQGEEGVAGMLVGSTSDGVFISGALALSRAGLEGGRLHLSQEAWTECYENLGTYFSGQDLCGIFVCEGSCRRFRRQALFAAVREAFLDRDSLLYLLTEEGEEIFYRITARSEERLQGYYCYFERNEAMQEYMMDNLPQRHVEWEGIDQRRVVTNQKEGELGDPVKRVRGKMRRQQEATVSQTSGRGLVGLCAVMALVIFVSGMGLVYREQSGVRMEDILNRLQIDPSRWLAVSVLPEETGERYGESYGQKDPGDNHTDPASGVGETGSSVVVEEIPGNVYPTEPSSAEGSSSAETTEGPSTDGPETEAPATEASETEETSADEPETEASSAEDVTKEADAGVIYVVQAGDSLYSICRRFYGTEEMASVIQQMNHLEDPNLIKEGQELLLP